MGLYLYKEEIMSMTMQELREQFYEHLQQANAAEAFEELRVR